jgi:hypothetical protein
MNEPLSPQALAWLRQSVLVDGSTYSRVLLHLLERVEALEKKYETKRLAQLEWGKDVDKLMRWSDDHLKRIMALESRPIPGSVELAADHLADASKMVPTPEAVPVATNAELCSAYNDAPEHGVRPGLRAVYDLGRQHGAAQPPAAQPTPPPAPAGGLVERVCGEMTGDDDPSIDARAAIREVAKWLRSGYGGREGYGTSWAGLIEEEANR